MWCGLIGIKKGMKTKYWVSFGIHVFSSLFILGAGISFVAFLPLMADEMIRTSVGYVDSQSAATKWMSCLK